MQRRVHRGFLRRGTENLLCLLQQLGVDVYECLGHHVRSPLPVGRNRANPGRRRGSAPYRRNVSRPSIARCVAITGRGLRLRRRHRQRRFAPSTGHQRSERLRVHMPASQPMARPTTALTITIALGPFVCLRSGGHRGERRSYQRLPLPIKETLTICERPPRCRSQHRHKKHARPHWTPPHCADLLAKWTYFQQLPLHDRQSFGVAISVMTPGWRAGRPQDATPGEGHCQCPGAEPT